MTVQKRLGVAMVVLAVACPLMPSSAAQATVSGENGKIAFGTTRNGNREIYVMEPDGSNPVNLTNHPADDRDPNWSPDGRHIAFVTRRSGSPEIYLMRSDGSNPRRLADGTEPEWSPDGTQIVFSADVDGLYLISIDGTDAVRITNPHAPDTPAWAGSSSDEGPAWSPDGSRIVFVRHHGGGATETEHLSRLYLISASDPSSGETALVDFPGFATDPDWSPDGTRIAVAHADAHQTSGGVVLIEVSSGLSTEIPTPDGYSHSVEPAWSPDGSLITTSVFENSTGTPPEIFAMSPSGEGATNLTNDPALDYSPAWQPLNPYPVGLVDTSAGIWHLRDEDAAVNTFYFGNPGDTPFLGDWDCDGVETPGVYRRSDGRIYLRNSNTQGIADYYFFFGNPGDLPMAGDFDGDDCDTVSLYRSSEQLFYISNELGANGGGLGEAEYFFMFGNPGDKPFVGDFDGDGVDTIGLHRESTGLVYIRNTNDTGVAHLDFFYGNPGDRLVAADWNGDNKDSPAVFRPGNTTMYFRFTNTQGIADAKYIWGERHWVPVAGDFTSS